MDDLYAINQAKTEYRDAFNLGDVQRILALANPELVNFSDGQPREFCNGELPSFEIPRRNLSQPFTAKLPVIVAEIRIKGDVPYDYGWHELTLTPKNGRQP